MKSNLVILGSLLLLGAQPSQDQQPVLTFFITSAGSGNGADLGGLEGADLICQTLAEAAGSKNVQWHAYLSTIPANGKPAVDARDRIGKGPWYNAKGVKVADNVADLHSDNNKLSKENSLTEKGAVVNGRGDTPNMHDILTGSSSTARPMLARVTPTATTGPEAGRREALAWGITIARVAARIPLHGTLPTRPAVAARRIW